MKLGKYVALRADYHLSHLSKTALLSVNVDSSAPHLRPGLYLVRSAVLTAAAEQIFAIYWPEETTWDNDAIPSVRRNRTTFMRYHCQKIFLSNHILIPDKGTLPKSVTKSSA